MISDMVRAARKASERLGVSFGLAAVLPDYLQPYCDGSPPGWRVRQHYKDILESQEEVGQAQVFCGRFSRLWGEAHEAELKLNKAEITGRSSGLAWASSMVKAIWGHTHKMWLARNAGRHGHGDEEKRN